MLDFALPCIVYGWIRSRCLMPCAGGRSRWVDQGGRCNGIGQCLWSAALHRCQKIRDWRDEYSRATVPKVWASTLRGWVYNNVGRPELAHQELEGDLPTSRTLDEAQSTVPHLGQLARSLAELGREKETATLIEEFLTLLKRTPSAHAHSIMPLLFACRWSIQNGSSEESLERAAQCMIYLERIATQFHCPEISRV